MRTPAPFTTIVYNDRFPSPDEEFRPKMQVAAITLPPEPTGSSGLAWTVSIGPNTPCNNEPDFMSVDWPDGRTLFGFANAARLVSFADHLDPLLIVVEHHPDIGKGCDKPDLALPGTWPRNLGELLDPRLTAASAARRRVVLGLGERVIRLGGEPDPDARDLATLGLTDRPRVSYGLVRYSRGDTLEIGLETTPQGHPPRVTPRRYYHAGLIVVAYPTEPITDARLFYGRWLRVITLDHLVLDSPMSEFRAWDPWTTYRNEPRQGRVHLVRPTDGSIVASYQHGEPLAPDLVGETRIGYGLTGFLARYRELFTSPVRSLAD